MSVYRNYDIYIMTNFIWLHVSTCSESSSGHLNVLLWRTVSIYEMLARHGIPHGCTLYNKFKWPEDDLFQVETCSHMHVFGGGKLNDRSQLENLAMAVSIILNRKLNSLGWRRQDCCGWWSWGTVSLARHTVCHAVSFVPTGLRPFIG
jgi:hypothetical protein